MKITIVGAGTVGLSFGALFAQTKNFDVTFLEDSDFHIACLKKGKFPDLPKFQQIQTFVDTHQLTFKAQRIDRAHHYATVQPDYVIFALPVESDGKDGNLQTKTLSEAIAQALEHTPKTTLLIIKSTVPIGYTRKLCEQHKTDRIVFCPEFLREKTPITDTQNPSRIIMGGALPQALLAVTLFKCITKNRKDVPVHFTSSDEAEAAKVFSNAYLAMRVTFFNELDTYAYRRHLDSEKIINLVGADPRIGNQYSTPSEGYGGKCLPKEVAYLTHAFRDQDLDPKLFEAVHHCNEDRKKHFNKR